MKKYSKHNITFCNEYEINGYDWNDFDIVHINGTICPQIFTTKAKTIYNIHAYILSCPSGGLHCFILNKYLKESLNCINCLGYLGMKTGFNRMKTYIKMAQKADIFAVHSEYMKDFYHVFNPTVLTLPMETDILKPYKDKEDYILYTGRLSFEKNPFGFVEIIKNTGLKGKMIIYNWLNEDLISTKKYYEDLFKCKDIEFIINPTKLEMIDLVKKAKFIVLPYFFMEPLGVATINSILCGTSVVSFPYGNFRNLTKLLPTTLYEMIVLLRLGMSSDSLYDCYLEDTMKMSDKLREVHNQEKVVKEWDMVYDKLGEIKG